MYYPTPKLLYKAWENGNPICVEHGRLGRDEINISSILNYLIHNVGRFCESYAGDMLYELKYIHQLISAHPVEPGEDSIIVFGIRRNGVDGTGFLMSRLKNDCWDHYSHYLYPERDYRKILAVRISTVADHSNGYLLPENGDTEVELRDLTDAFHSMEKEDADWNYENDGADRAKFLRKYVQENRERLSAAVYEKLNDFADMYDRGRIPGIDG